MKGSLIGLAVLFATSAAAEPRAPAVTPATAFANDQAAFDFFIGKGLPAFQAAGIVGNLDQESGVDPTAVQSGGPGRGIAQWSVGGRWDTTANDNVLAYATAQGEASSSLQLQLEFIWYELTTIGYGFSSLEATTNVTDATTTFMDKFEICGTCDASQRVAYAQAVLAAYGSIPYAASYVSQTWPLASAPAMTIHCGERIAATLVLENTGTDSWDSSTRLATTMPRNRTSAFAGTDWVAPDQPAEIAGTVAPGQQGTFAFSFTGPTGSACVPGTYTEYFGIEQDGVGWFSDTGNGGPPDDQIEALIALVPSAGSGSSAGSDGTGSNAGSGDSGSSAGSGADENGEAPTTFGGCSTGGGDASWAVFALGALALSRRRQFRDHQGKVPSVACVNPPDGPSGPISAIRTASAAPSSTDSVPS